MVPRCQSETPRTAPPPPIPPAHCLVHRNVSLPSKAGAGFSRFDRSSRLRVPPVKTLPIIWKRLVSAEGKTCERCGATHSEIERAVAKLKAALRPLGIEPALEEQVISQASFQADPSESNRVWISGRPMEDWLGARVGSTPCCSVCGDSECRTVEVGGTTFEALPEQLIIRAALVAASTLIDVKDDPR